MIEGLPLAILPSHLPLLPLATPMNVSPANIATAIIMNGRARAKVVPRSKGNFCQLASLHSRSKKLQGGKKMSGGGWIVEGQLGGQPVCNPEGGGAGSSSDTGSSAVMVGVESGCGGVPSTASSIPRVHLLSLFLSMKVNSPRSRTPLLFASI